MRFSDLIPNLGAETDWPIDLVSTAFPPHDSDIESLLAQLDEAIEITHIVTDVSADGTVTFTGKLQLRIAPAPTELTGRLFPNLRFLFVPTMQWKSDFVMSLAQDGTATLQIDTVPLEVRLPADLLAAHPKEAAADTGITLTEDSTYSVIKRNFTVYFEAEGHLRLDPDLPISIGPCTLTGIPLKGIHDLNFIGAPARAHKVYGWVVRPLSLDGFLAGCGGLGFGGIEVDWSAENSPLASLRKKLNIDDDAELVIEDVVTPAAHLPFVPRHGTIGIRRTIGPNESLEDQLTFADAPVRIPFSDSAGLFLSQFFYKTPDAEEPLLDGLSVEAGVSVSFGGDDSDRWESELGLIDGDVVRLSVARPLPQGGGPDLPLLHLDLWKVNLDLFRLRLGVSISELQKENPGFRNAVQALGDILIKEKTGADAKKSKGPDCKTEDGRPFEMAITDAGWDRGKLSWNITKLDKLCLKLGPFALEIHELGLVQEHGATYLSLSGGIRQKTNSMEGSVWFKRMRGPLAGNPDAPRFKIDGVGAELKNKVVEIAAHGHYRDEILVESGTPIRLKEHGLGGKIVIKKGGGHGLSVDVYWGERIPDGADPTRYGLFQVVYFGTIPIWSLSITQIEMLYADNLVPKLSSQNKSAGELKYYAWLKKSRPTALMATRGLSQWKPEQDAWAFGMGFGMSFTALESCLKLISFGLGFEGKKDSGLIIVSELMLLESKKPIALGVFEYDFEEDAFVLHFKVDLSLGNVIKNWPNQKTMKIGGTITIANKPCLIAFGRIDNQDSWPGLTIDAGLGKIFKAKYRLAVCFEWMEDAHTAFGLIASAKFNCNIKVVVFDGWFVLLLKCRWMKSGTGDFAAQLQIDLGASVKVFRFLKFGISSTVLAEWLAHTPDYFHIRATFRFDTPWYLPDVSVSIECIDGTLEPSARQVLASPLQNSTALSLQGVSQLKLQRIDGKAGGEKATLYSLDEMPSSGFWWDGDDGDVPLDGTVEIHFSPMLVDKLGVGNTNSDLGEDCAGTETTKLSARYALTGLSVRRRRLGDVNWETVETLTSPTDSRNFRWSWDDDTRTGGETAPKKLIFNGATPFLIAQSNPTADSEILMENPAYPCCQRREAGVARVDFCASPLGGYPDGLSRSFEWWHRGGSAPIRLRTGAYSVHAPAQSGASCGRVAAYPIKNASVFSVSSEEDLHQASIHLAGSGRKIVFNLVARNALGDEVFRVNDSMAGHQPFKTLLVNPESAFRTVDFYARVPDRGTNAESVHYSIELDWIECVTVADQEQAQADIDRCDRVDSEGHGEELPFLGRHEYEISVQTEMEVRHTATEWEKKGVTEKIRFVTKGPPGLNETAEPGLELQPYVISNAAGGRGLAYREEEVHLVLSPKLKLFGPGTSGNDENSYRLPTTLTVSPNFESKPSLRHDNASYESEEWFEKQRSLPTPLVAITKHNFVLAMSEDPLVQRYRDLSETSSGTCPPDSIWNEYQPSHGVDPFGDETDGTWQANTDYRAVMRPEASPFVDRKPFEPGDATVLKNRTGTWSVEDGSLKAAGFATGQFGEDSWDYLHMEIEAAFDGGSQIGASVQVSEENEGGGIRFMLVKRPGQPTRLTGGNVDGTGDVQREDLPEDLEDIVLQIDTFADAVRCRVAGMEISVSREVAAPGCATFAQRARQYMLWWFADLKCTGSISRQVAT